MYIILVHGKIRQFNVQKREVQCTYTHRTTESNTLIGYITLAIDSNRGTLELNSLYPRFPVKAQ